ncbi:hypothetical protein [Enterococcus durans]|uniref:hypothetical protein n=3 Tax=Enterococcus durans TaxID=53345 RepID=UPI0012FD93CD|nr:hypothetical protein [Enterococcus durans]
MVLTMTNRINYFKSLMIFMTGIFLFNCIFPATKVLATEIDGNVEKMNLILENDGEIEQAFSKIMEYSTYDYETKQWILSHDIVSDGYFTEQQFQNAEKAGSLWKNVEDTYISKTGSQKRVLPVLLILAIKAVGVIVGTVVVTKMTEYFLTWGISSGCRKYKQYSMIKSFCTANGFL